VEALKKGEIMITSHVILSCCVFLHMMSAEIPFLRDSTTSKTRALCDAQVDVTHERTRAHKNTHTKSTCIHTHKIFELLRTCLDEVAKVDVTHSLARTHTITYTHTTYTYKHTK